LDSDTIIFQLGIIYLLIMPTFLGLLPFQLHPVLHLKALEGSLLVPILLLILGLLLTLLLQVFVPINLQSNWRLDFR